MEVLYVIRRAKLEDMEKVMEINKKELPENYSSDFFYEMLNTYGDFFFVAELKGDIVGYVMSRIETSFSFSSSPPFFLRGHVVSLAVSSGFRRMGIGFSLMRTSHEEMKKHGVKEVYLEVRVDNDPAISLYKKLGYSIVRKIPYYYADGTDAYMMSLKL
ncbi:MAG: ribosomal protein S18-alanine N-acetyltransferase [Candidatus Brockarchaeota archaeon]|nr:ribosomal protein S18-alanine N-acetyltransferase [Candidatus Brockarchaeota archaeon]MBO3800941.1 ribosomal protein S18-alanine N-acetyltransferase [Candidatus Brockarchaeota archaeon]